MRASCTPWRARLGASLPPGAACVEKLSGTATRSISRFRKASQRGWSSSITDTSTRSTIGRRRPLKRAASAWPCDIVGVRLGVVQQLAEVRVALEHHLRAAPPLHEAEGAGAHGMVADGLAVELVHFARHGAEEAGVGDGVDEARARALELELQGVAVERANALHRAVVVERLVALQRLLAQRLEADHAFLVVRGVARALVASGRRSASTNRRSPAPPARAWRP